MGRSVLQPTSRLLNHSEVFYAPGDRALARELFRAIGCRVLDPQEEEGPPDLGAAADECRTLPWAAADAELAAAAASLDPATLDEATVLGLLEFAGLSGADSPGLPEDSAGIQALLESLPAPLRDRLLAGFFSAIFTAARS